MAKVTVIKTTFFSLSACLLPEKHTKTWQICLKSEFGSLLLGHCGMNRVRDSELLVLGKVASRIKNIKRHFFSSNN